MKMGGSRKFQMKVHSHPESQLSLLAGWALEINNKWQGTPDLTE